MKWKKVYDRKLKKWCTDHDFVYLSMDDLSAAIYDSYNNKIAQIRNHNGNIYFIGWYLNYNPFTNNKKIKLPDEDDYEVLRISNKTYTNFQFKNDEFEKHIEEMKIDLLKLPQTIEEVNWRYEKLKIYDKIKNLKN